VPSQARAREKQTLNRSPDKAASLPRKSRRDIAQRFRGHWLQGYVRGKLRNDPVYASAAAIIAACPAPVLDVGCGPGLLAHYLDACGIDVPYHGVDTDKRKITRAREAAEGLGQARFEQADCLNLPEWQGHVILLDVLHYLDGDKQMQLLHAAVPGVAPGASLVIRTVLRDRSWRFRATQAEEAFIRGSRWIRGGVKHYPRSDELLPALQSAGLAVEKRPMFGHTPFNSHLILATRHRED
jgi:2-polyprenyl-3-methyl-5-hydroxy-6-metoxy-1,4-benzoquinol methylase